MADHNLTKRELSLSLNEEKSCVKNRVEQKLLNKRLGFIKREYDYNNFLLRETTKIAENEYKVVRLSTGSAFKDNNSNKNEFDQISKNLSKLIKTNLFCSLFN